MRALAISPNRRFLVYDDGTPFFYLGDTAWELFHRTTREEAGLYLANRAAKGFTAVQAVALAEVEGLDVPNAYGHLPLIDKDPARPNEAYFAHVDWIVQRANALGMYVALLPTWGKYVQPDAWDAEQIIFDPEKARAYGAFLGRRYADAGIIWMLGGDRQCHGGRHQVGRRPAVDHLPPLWAALFLLLAARRALARSQHAAVGPRSARQRELCHDRP